MARQKKGVYDGSRANLNTACRRWMGIQEIQVKLGHLGFDFPQTIKHPIRLALASVQPSAQ